MTYIWRIQIEILWDREGAAILSSKVDASISAARALRHHKQQSVRIEHLARVADMLIGQQPARWLPEENSRIELEEVTNESPQLFDDVIVIVGENEVTPTITQAPTHPPPCCLRQLQDSSLRCSPEVAARSTAVVLQQQIPAVHGKHSIWVLLLADLNLC